MKIKKIYLFIILFVILGGLYAFNLFNINKVSNLALVKPTKLSFVVIAQNKSDCKKCFNTQSLISAIKKMPNIKISGVQTVTSLDTIYGKLIKKYNIKNLPSIIISGDISNKNIIKVWKYFSAVKVKDSIVIQNLLPYYDIASKKPKGLVSAVVLEDNTCKDCFDGMDYIKMIEQRNIAIKNYKILDISSKEGAYLVKKYKITKIPAVILSPDANDYSGFANSWKEIGTREKDGSFVLRSVKKVAGNLKFKNLKSI